MPPIAMRTRFAPSPTGYLHLGHGYAALKVMEFARAHGAKTSLRIEDIDATRCRPEFTDAILEDLHWLGFAYDEVIIQSQRLELYAQALAQLQAMGLAYRCFCSRKDIAAAALETGPEGPLYPGTCRHIAPDEAAERATHAPYGWRFDHAKAAAMVGDNLVWHDDAGQEMPVNPAILGDILLAGRDRPASYHLAVVVDDARPDRNRDTHINAPELAISHVVRGRDLLHATHIHRLLQAVLGYAAPVYHHHALLVMPDGRKLSKSDQSLTLRSLRAGGMDAAALIDDLQKHRFPVGILCDDA